MNSHLYSDARRRLDLNRNIQFEKAAEKYPEPLNPSKWTAQQLGDHAAQELIDLSHYLEGLVWQAEKGCEAVKLLGEIHDKIIRLRMVGDSLDLKEITGDISKFFEQLKGGE